MGATGNVTGPHTHYEIRKDNNHIDPTPYMGIPNMEGKYEAKNYMFDENIMATNSSSRYIVVADVLNVRQSPNGRIKKYEELSEDAKNQILKKAGWKANGYVKNMVCDVLEISGAYGRTPSGWVSLDYCKKI
ncbi:MAG: M23 family metallopeptidase [Clostridia bacterium]